jgi:hypothetical protein
MDTPWQKIASLLNRARVSKMVHFLYPSVQFNLSAMKQSALVMWQIALHNMAQINRRVKAVVEHSVVVQQAASRSWGDAIRQCLGATP